MGGSMWLSIVYLVSVVGYATGDISCYYCIHGEGGASLLTMTSNDLSDGVLTAYQDYFQSVTNADGAKYKTHLDITPHSGDECKTPVDTTKVPMFNCTDQSGDGNIQQCGAIHILTKSGGNAWARGCIADGLCDLYGNKTIVDSDKKSKIHIQCCDTPDCNTHDVDATGGTSAGWRFGFSSTCIVATLFLTLSRF